MEKRHSFKGSIGFVLAASASAVGLGNIWRFPYLAAQDGGGLFLVTYIFLALTFGFTLLTTEVAIGRKTKQGPLTAYGKLNHKARHMGIISWLVPTLIFPYYCAIGGWVLKYFVTYITGHGAEAASDDYFTGFITSQYSPIIYMVIFMAACAFIVYKGVNSGIEKSAKIIMPILIILVIGIAIYSLTLSHTDAEGTRTGLEGLKVYIIPDLKSTSIGQFFKVLMDAMGQLFYSISVAMGIMIAYGSYVKDEENLMSSINQIELFDSIVAFLAGVMIIPAVVVFMGKEGMQNSGPGLMFVALPKVFESMGSTGSIVAIVFFMAVLFAALTSAVSILEAIVSSYMDRFNMPRHGATSLSSAIGLVMALLVCLGYNLLYFELHLPNQAPGKTGQILDVLDYLANYIFMPVISIATCIFVGWVLTPDAIISEVTKNGEKFGREKLYRVMIKYIAPLLLFLLLLQSLGLFNSILY